jgi:lysophospholipase L1-like esterase
VSWSALAIDSAALASSVLLLILLQGSRVRATTPVLRPAAGPTEGRAAGRGPALRVALLGESTVAGVGASTHEESLAGRTADALARITGRSVEWRAIGFSGATARTTRRVLLDKLPEAGADAVALVLGVNDTVTLRPAPLFARDLVALVRAVRHRTGEVPIVVAGVPPLGVFPALPQPLRGFMGLQARSLDAAAARLVRSLPKMSHVPMRGVRTADFAADGYHPCPEGYALWGQALGCALGALLEASR